jgi:hypothetical protein
METKLMPLNAVIMILKYKVEQLMAKHNNLLYVNIIKIVFPKILSSSSKARATLLWAN